MTPTTTLWRPTGPAEDLAEFNTHIVDRIEVTHEFHPPA